MPVNVSQSCRITSTPQSCSVVFSRAPGTHQLDVGDSLVTVRPCCRITLTRLNSLTNQHLSVMQAYINSKLSVKDRRAARALVKDLASEQPALSAQVVPMFKDPDPCRAYVALDCAKLLLGDKGGPATALMLQAGAPRELVSAMKHPDRYCRSMAASATAGAIYDDDIVVTSDSRLLREPALDELRVTPETEVALLHAGLVPALMTLIFEGDPPCASGVSRPYRAQRVFDNVKVLVFLDVDLIIPNDEPVWHAYNALTLITLTTNDTAPAAVASRVQAAAEVARTPQAAARFVRDMGTFGRYWLPVYLMTVLLKTLHCFGGSAHEECKCAFCDALVEAGLLDYLPQMLMILPRQMDNFSVMLKLLLLMKEVLGPACLPSKVLEPLMQSLASLIQEGPGDPDGLRLRGRAAICLEWVVRRIAKERPTGAFSRLHEELGGDHGYRK